MERTYTFTQAEAAALLRAVYQTLDKDIEAYEEADDQAAAFRQMAAEPGTRMGDHYLEDAAGWQHNADLFRGEADKLRALADRLSRAE